MPSTTNSFQQYHLNINNLQKKHRACFERIFRGKIQSFCDVGAEKERKKICEQIGIDKSVLSRELSRNSNKRTSKYNPDLAQRKYEHRLSEKPKFVRFTEDVKQKVISDLEFDLSSEQISGRAKLEGVACVSHETIYQFIWQDKKRGGKLHKHLRNKGRKYRKRGSYKNSRGIIKNRVSIEERPQIVEEKVRFGDLEIDIIIGKNHKGALLTITDRVTLMEWIAKLSGKNAEELAQTAIKILQPFQNQIYTIFMIIKETTLQLYTISGIM